MTQPDNNANLKDFYKRKAGVTDEFRDALLKAANNYLQGLETEETKYALYAMGTSMGAIYGAMMAQHVAVETMTPSDQEFLASDPFVTGFLAYANVVRKLTETETGGVN